MIEPSDLITQMDQDADVGDYLEPEIDGAVQAIIERLWACRTRKGTSLCFISLLVCAPLLGKRQILQLILFRLCEGCAANSSMLRYYILRRQSNEPAGALSQLDTRDAIARGRRRLKNK
jgi:hypothetical protein